MNNRHRRVKRLKSEQYKYMVAVGVMYSRMFGWKR